jgi:1,4-dihydroxy-2-naphthoate octaprenyltransferase
MASLKTWIRAARPRTVLLSFSGVLLGGFLAYKTGPSTGSGTLLCVLFAAITAVLLQILSNLANDYGDFKKGTDNAKRVGPQREMQSGAITEKEMKWALVIVSGLCLLSGFLLLFVYVTTILVIRTCALAENTTDCPLPSHVP